MKKNMKANILSTIIATLVLFISGIGTYAVKGILADLKTSVLKIKADVFREFESYYNSKIEKEFEEMKSSIREDLKENTALRDSIQKENITLEVKSILSKERLKIQEILREELEKFSKKSEKASE
ncbi:conserved hypothetical protein (plasmid) [Borreliella afzelii PKo]|uniref:Uncharacterized protein n=1 Tax=Borreliella afzelii (strain PKo) TaxID=390236 RepID=Q0SL21_BORAP|nr:hypothetical protein BAPKO_5505 [Borreliella afzelii PKo]AEL70500.1 conserved hypothetical protein [Borreliella afzelii PKo]